MRTIATVALSLFFGSAFAQAPTYSRITLDPTVTVPAGDVICISVSSISGYSLVLSNAGNLSRDPSAGTQMYMVSPEGDAERIPMEKVYTVPRQLTTTLGFIEFSKISPRGSAAMIRANDGQFYFYQRAGKHFRKVHGITRPIGFLSETSVLVVREVGPDMGSPFQLNGWSELLRYDFESGKLTPYEALPTGIPVLDRLGLLQGRKLVYLSPVDSKYHLFDVKNQVDTATALSSFGDGKVDGTGTYLDRLVVDGNESVLSRTNLFTGVKENLHRYPYATPGLINLDAAYEDRALLFTSIALTNDEITFGWDVYEFNAASGETSLLSRKSDGTASNNLPSYGGLTYYVPDGSAAIYQTSFPYLHQSPLLPAPGEWLYAFNQSYRQAVGQPRQPVARAMAGGGANSRGYVASRNLSAVLYAASEPGVRALTKFLVRDSAVRTNGRVVGAVETQDGAPYDVSDDGRFAVYLKHAGQSGPTVGYHLYVQDAQTGETRVVTQAFPSGVLRRTQGKVDQDGNLFFITDTTDRYPGLTGNWLFRFEMATGTLTPVRAVGERPSQEPFAVGGGRVAYTVGTIEAPSVIILDPFTGQERARTPINEPNALLALANDRKTLSIGYSRSTDLFDIPSGIVRATLPLPGTITPSGEWIVGASQVCYVPTASVFWQAPYGAQIGPLVLGSAINGPVEDNVTKSYIGQSDRGGDIWRYRVAIPTSPLLTDARINVTRATIIVRGGVVAAGLQSAETWIEARVNGGEWQRLVPDPNLGQLALPSPDGLATVELRARDARGRTSEIEPFSIIGDLSAPVLSDISAIVSGTEATIRFTNNEAGTTGVRFGVEATNSFVAGGYRGAGVQEIRLTGLQPNTTYKYVVQATDRVSNLTSSEEYTFTTGS
ncbi:hypothetical protein EON81_00090 [bacterium]|nr:MAG: hypothetical protein EON81_00090 [bacterium]